MKYWSYLLFILFIIGGIIFMRNILKPSEEEIQITGSEKCNECHILQSLGNQTDIWKKSAHSRAYNTLLTDTAINFTRANNLIDANVNELCLKCHTTKYFLSDKGQNEYYNMSEGVGCESCHGAGSVYLTAEKMKDKNLFLQSGGIICDETVCIKCHSPEANHQRMISESVCPFQEKEFNYEALLKKINHPLNKNNFR